MITEKFQTDPLAARVPSSILTGKRGQSEENTIKVQQVDFLKMDVEGRELDLLPALADAGVLDDIRYVAVETQ